MDRLEKYKYYDNYEEDFEMSKEISKNYNIYDDNNAKSSNWVYKQQRISSIYSEITNLITQNKQVIGKNDDFPASLLILDTRLYYNFIYRI